MFLGCCGLLPWPAQGAALERGLAVTDPLALRELDLREQRGDAAAPSGFGLNRMLDPEAAFNAPIDNDGLFALPAMAPVRKALDDDFDRYIADRKAESPTETVGVGPPFDFQLFDRALLYSGQTRFVLSGIVNRMDRAYVAPQDCGEIRLIYRLTRVGEPAPAVAVAVPGEGGVSQAAAVAPPPSARVAAASPATEAAIASQRLPMTLNIVLKAKGDGAAVSCAEIARRWLATADWTETGAALAARLIAPGGPLELVRPANIDRIETNLQIAHAPKSRIRDFRTDYLLKVFDYDRQARIYREVPLENQVDRERIMADPALGREFKDWLLDPKHLGELDRGTVLIPDKFLKVNGIAPTPIGFGRSSLQPAFGLVEGADTGSALFKQDDVVTALQNATEHGVDLQNIQSAAGFERRLNDIGCAGCHQTRGIGGFHFPGVDWMVAKPSNAVVVPASPHFFGDQVRRRDIVTAFRDDKAPDFSRGFSDRPQSRGTTELAGTEYADGWGAHCYQQHADAADNDRSFVSWSCAAGLACEMMGTPEPSPRIGMCFVKRR
jgi:hypothetical protein